LIDIVNIVCQDIDQRHMDFENMSKNFVNLKFPS